MKYRRPYTATCRVALISLLLCTIQFTASGQFRDFEDISKCTKWNLDGINPDSDTSETGCPEFYDLRIFRAQINALGDTVEIPSPKARIIQGESAVIKVLIRDDSELRKNDTATLEWDAGSGLKRRSTTLDENKNTKNTPYEFSKTINAEELELGEIPFQITGNFTVPGDRIDRVKLDARRADTTFTVTTIQGYIPDQRVSVGDSIAIDLNSIFSDRTTPSPLTYELLSADTSVVIPRLDKNRLILEGKKTDITSIDLKVTTESHDIVETFKLQVTAIEGAIADQRVKLNDEITLEVKSFFTHPTDDLQFDNLQDTYNTDVVTATLASNQLTLTGNSLGETEISLSVKSDLEEVTETFSVQVTDIEGSLPDLEVCINGNVSLSETDLRDIFTLNGANLPADSFELVDTHNTNLVNANLDQGILTLRGLEIGSTELVVLVTSGLDQYLDRFRVNTASCSAISGTISDVLLRKDGAPFVAQLDSIFAHSDSLTSTLTYTLTSPDFDTEIIEVDLDENTKRLTVTGKSLGTTPLALEVTAGQDTLINTVNVTVIEGDITDQFLCIDDPFITQLDSIYAHPNPNFDLSYQIVDGSFNSDIVRLEQDQNLLTVTGQAPGETPITLRIFAGQAFVEDTFTIQVSRIEGTIADQFLRQDSTHVIPLDGTFNHPDIQALDFAIVDSSFDENIITPDLGPGNALTIKGLAFGSTSLSIQVSAGQEVCVYTFNVLVTAIQGGAEDQVIFVNDSATINLNEFYSHSEMESLDYSPGDPLDDSIVDVEQIADTLLRITSIGTPDTTTIPLTITADQDVFQDSFKVIVTNTPLVVAPIDSLVLPVGQLYTQSLAPVFKPQPITDYDVRSQDTSIVVASLSGSLLQIFPVKEGTTRITYGATNDASSPRSFVDSSFVITVVPPPFLRAFPDIETLTLNQDVRDTLDLNAFFGSRGNIPINFTAKSNDSSIARAIVSDTDRTLIISLGDSADTGQQTDIIVSGDILGNQVTDSFKVIVNTPPTFEMLPDILWAVPNADSLKVMEVPLTDYFSDPDSTSGDRLTFSATSSDPASVSATISGGILRLEPLVLVDDATIPVEITATDTRTGSISTSLSTRITRLAAPLGTIQISRNAAVEDRDLPVSIILETSEINIDQANFSYRRGGDAGFITLSKDNAAVQSLNDGRTEYTFTIKGSHLTSRGLEHRFDARSISGDVVSMEPESPVISLPDGLSAPPIASGDHILFSMPIQDQKAYDVLDESLGPAGSNRWRLWDASQAPDGEFALQEATSNSNMDLIPGKAYWLYVSESAIDLIQSLPNAFVNPVNQPFEIPLAAGWQLVGNPFAFPVPLSKVSIQYADKACLPTLRPYAGKVIGWPLPEDLELTEIEPFAGYAVYADTVGTLRIDPDIHTQETSSLPGCETQSEEAPSMAISIAASSGEVANRVSVAAISSQSSADWDRSDQPSLPVIGEYVNVYFHHPEWEKPTSKFQVDARPEIQEGQVWEFKVESNTYDKVDLSFAGIEEIDEEYEVWLVDDVLNASINLRQTPTYSIGSSTSHAPRALKLVVGTPAFQQEVLGDQQGLPTDYSLSQNFPNPFHQSTTISYSLPEAQPVSIEIFDVLGRRVTTLMQAEEMPAGVHAAIWDGRNTAGEVVASGLYIITWKAGNTVKTSKATLVR